MYISKQFMVGLAVILGSVLVVLLVSLVHC